ncbi:MAG: hypothetical protein Q9M09_04940 [Mariprofundaceae bacterium]|nr:hypothetical protein [Mariprofundaceae bacterium]
MARYVSFFATPMLSKKTSEFGKLFIARYPSTVGKTLLNDTGQTTFLATSNNKHTGKLNVPAAEFAPYITY